MSDALFAPKPAISMDGISWRDLEARQAREYVRRADLGRFGDDDDEDDRGGSYRPGVSLTAPYFFDGYLEAKTILYFSIMWHVEDETFRKVMAGFDVDNKRLVVIPSGTSYKILSSYYQIHPDLPSPLRWSRKSPIVALPGAPVLEDGYSWGAPCALKEEDP